MLATMALYSSSAVAYASTSTCMRSKRVDVASIGTKSEVVLPMSCVFKKMAASKASNVHVAFSREYDRLVILKTVTATISTSSSVDVRMALLHRSACDMSVISFSASPVET